MLQLHSLQHLRATIVYSYVPTSVVHTGHPHNHHATSTVCGGHDRHIRRRRGGQTFRARTSTGQVYVGVSRSTPGGGAPGCPHRDGDEVLGARSVRDVVCHFPDTNLIRLYIYLCVVRNRGDWCLLSPCVLCSALVCHCLATMVALDTPAWCTMEHGA